jgi:hypothetical protein
MKFRRNVKEEKLFYKVAIGSLVVFIILLVIYLITFNSDILRLLGSVLVVVPLYFFGSRSLKRDFVEFQEDKIIIINSNARNIEINISEIETIILPSAKALKSKKEDNPIVIKRVNTSNIISYSVEIENYIKENLSNYISYYDDYLDTFK